MDVRMGRVSITIVVAEKQNVLHILSTCLYPLLSSMKCMCTPSVICVLSGFTTSFHISHKQHDFRKKVKEYTKRVSTFSTILNRTFVILRRIQRDIIINVHRYA